MKNNLNHTLGLFKFKADHTRLREAISQFSLKDDSCYFCFNLLTDRCLYFCPSVTGMLGYDNRIYRNKGFLFFKKLIHPVDSLYCLDAIITLVASAENESSGIFTGDHSGISLRIRHKNGDWQPATVYLVYLKETKQVILKILLGFVDWDFYDREDEEVSLSAVTEREKEVFRYLSDGYSAKMTAERLHIRESTVISHRKNLIGKLGVRNSAEMIRRGFELNILNSRPVFA